ncbi:MAG: hypothetical protein DCC68_10020 [Planctomycetota bacterium]|nr:MAG: hypothetical protein DCC68_10020 [Planctomycetota bacterium]
MTRYRFPNLQPPTSNLSRPAFSLLEVILALAILAASMAVLGQLVQFGMTNARRAEDMTQAAIICESIMAEIVAGDRGLTNESAATYEENDTFVYSIDIPTGAQEGLLEVHVVVETNPEYSAEPIRCALVRWMVDPDYASSATSGTTTN